MRSGRLVGLIIAASVLESRVAPAQLSGASLASYQQAKATLDAAIAAHGGDERIRAVEDVTIAFKGRRHMEYQSFKATKPWDVMPTEWTLILDLKGSRLRRDAVDRYPKDFEFTGNQVVKPDGGFWFDPKRAGKGDAIFKFGAQAYGPSRVGWSREAPAFVLVRARERASTLRSLGSATDGGKRYDVITFAENDGQQYALWLDATTRLLDRIETLRDDGIAGDQTVATRFSGYRPVNGVQFPSQRQELRNGEPTREGTLSVTVNTRPNDSLFAVPQGYVDAPADRGAEGQAVRKLADNVWLLQQLPGGNKVMIVAFNDYVLVFETPLPQGAAQAVMDVVRQTVPGKPIRYVTFSHHHDDHGGGLRPYISEGITIVTTPTNKRFVDLVATSKHTIAPDALSRAPKAPVVEIFSGKRVFTDGTMTVELHELGPNSHVDEMVLAYLPKERLIFQGDLVILPDNGEVPPANTLTAEFLKKIDDMKWQVETIAGVHGRVATLADIRSAVEKRGRGVTQSRQ